MAREVVFVEGARTAFGAMGGTLKDIYATDLSAIAVRGLVDKTKILEKGKVDSLFCGSAFPDARAMGQARYTVLNAGLPLEVSASYVEMQCGSAIDSINHAAWKILAGEADVMIAGGMESYSQMVVKFSTATAPYKAIPPMPLSPSLAPTKDQDISMLEVSDGMAKKWGVDRQACDDFALRSQHRAGKATAAGNFKDEIVPVTIKDKKKGDYDYVADEFVRGENAKMEDLQKLKAVMGEGCVTTAGNASGRNDGAAFVLMMTAEKAKEFGYKPYAKWVGGADWGVEPRYMGIGPAFSNLLALKRAGLTLKDVDLIECNEAFAAQNLGVIKEMEDQTGVKINQENWNPQGGAIAFGHPNGASGARICMFAFRELARRGGKYALYGACCGGGHGVSTLLENLRV
jgi:acetyl-CoA C-acetyltransferase